MKTKINNRSIEIRNSSWDDYNYCYLLTKNNMLSFYVKHNLEWKAEVYKKNFTPKYIKILEYNKRRIGFYKLTFKEDSWYLADLQISWLLRGKGIGTKILWIIETIVKKKKYNKLKLKVFFDNPAVNLYKRLGYNILEKESERFLMVKYI